MLRLAFLIAVAVLIWFAVETAMRSLRRLGQSPQDRRGPIPPPRKPETPSEPLVRCAVCGTHVPRSRALPAGPGEGTEGALFCSERCRQMAPPS